VWSKAPNAYDNSDTGIVGSHPNQGMDVFLMSSLKCEFTVLEEEVIKSSTFRDITTCSPSKVNWLIFTLCLAPHFTLIYCLAYSSTLKMEAICISEMSVDSQRSIRHYIPRRYIFFNMFLLSCICNGLARGLFPRLSPSRYLLDIHSFNISSGMRTAQRA
jgi:hypothetical protein